MAPARRGSKFHRNRMTILPAWTSLHACGGLRKGSPAMHRLPKATAMGGMM
jgi:hypothetical protein